MSSHLDIGCGSKPRNPYNRLEIYGVDISLASENSSNFKSANLFSENIPFETNFFDSVSAYDFLEHVPRVITHSNSYEIRFAFIELMFEIWRVLKPDGFFLASTPFYPNPEVFVDPTHINFITDKTHKYFCGDLPLAKIYGFAGQFEVVNISKWKPRGEYPFKKKNFKKKLELFRDIIKRRRSHIVWELKAIKER